MEGMSWYDMVSLHYWNPSKAFSILNSQDRGLFFTQPDQMPKSNAMDIYKNIMVQRKNNQCQ